MNILLKESILRQNEKILKKRIQALALPSYTNFLNLVVQPLSHVRLFVTPWTAGFSVLHCSWSLLKLMSIESVMSSNHLILHRPLLHLPSIFPSIRVFSNESASGGQRIGVSASACPSNEHLGLISFGMDWFGLLAVSPSFCSP